MISRSKNKKTLLAGLAAAALGAFAAAAPAQAQWGSDWDDDIVERPLVRREVVVERPIVRRTVVVERPMVRRTVVVERPVHVRRVVRRPVYVHRAAYIERPWRPRRWHAHRWHEARWDRPRWRERHRCWLPERYLCR